VTEADLLPKIRHKILAGELPREDCHVTWYGPGRGQPCAACDLLVPATEVEVECDLPGGGVICLHERCYDVWSMEWRAVH